MNEKVEIKLSPDLVSRGLGFTDTQGKQELRHEAGKSVVVARTPFVNLKIQSGEVTLIKTIEDADTSKETESVQPLPAESEDEKKKAKK